MCIRELGILVFRKIKRTCYMDDALTKQHYEFKENMNYLQFLIELCL